MRRDQESKVPANLILAVRVQKPTKGLLGKIRFFLLQEVVGPEAIRDLLRQIMSHDRHIPDNLRGEFTFGHNGGLPSIRAEVIFAILRDNNVAEGEKIYNIVLEHYMRARAQWATLQGIHIDIVV